MGADCAHDQLRYHSKLMPLTINPKSSPPVAKGYAFTAHQLAIKYHNAHHFIGAVIYDETGDIFEFDHLVKKEGTCTLWETSFANKIGRLFSRHPAPKGDQHLLLHLQGAGPVRQTTYLRSHLLHFFGHRKKNNIAHASPPAAIASTIPAIKPCPPPT
jgi:hypothetical protein